MHTPSHAAVTPPATTMVPFANKELAEYAAGEVGTAEIVYLVCALPVDMLKRLQTTCGELHDRLPVRALTCSQTCISAYDNLNPCDVMWLLGETLIL